MKTRMLMAMMVLSLVVSTIGTSFACAGSINGYVYDSETGKGIRDVKVTDGNTTAKTDSAGYYDLQTSKNGTVSITATKSGMTDAKATVYLVPNGATTRDFKLQSSSPDWVIALLGGIVQLILGIVLAITSIMLGLKLMTKLLPKIKIWDELKKKNLAVGLMAAGIVIAYTQVINTGIRGMSEAVAFADNKVLGFVGGLVAVIVGIGLASLGVTLAFKAMDKLTKDIDETEELTTKQNVAIGIFYAGVMFGVSAMIAAAVSGLGKAFGIAFGSLLF